MRILVHRSNTRPVKWKIANSTGRLCLRRRLGNCSVDPGHARWSIFSAEDSGPRREQQLPSRQLRENLGQMERLKDGCAFGHFTHRNRSWAMLKQTRAHTIHPRVNAHWR